MFFETEESITAFVEWVETSALNERRSYQSAQADIAMRECLRKWGCPQLATDSENYHHLKMAPEILVSRTHSGGIAAATLARAEKCLSVGVDIEFSNRPMQKKAEKFFRHPRDTESDTLRLWCLKEAIFKAIDPVKSELLSLSRETVLILSDFWVEKDVFGHKNSLALGRVQITELTPSERSVFFALCFVSKT